MGRPRKFSSPSERTAAWKRANPERAKEHNRRAAKRWKEKHPDRVAESSAAERLSYGLTVEDIDALYERQSGRCAICLEPEGDRRLCIDHDHATMVVRGLLCSRCNSGLGLLRDSTDNLIRAVEYLSRPS